MVVPLSRFGQGLAAVQIAGGVPQEVSMERAASGQTAVFPLPLLVRILNSTDSSTYSLVQKKWPGQTALT